MSETTYYKLGLCPCGDAHSPFYISAATQTLPNELPGYYSIINSQIPNVVTIRFEVDRQSKDPKSNDDYQKPVNDPNFRHSFAQIISQTNTHPFPPSRKPTILRAVMGTPSENPQRRLTPTNQTPFRTPPLPINNSRFEQNMPSFKPSILPKPSTSEGSHYENQKISVQRTTSLLTQGRAVADTAPNKLTRHESLPSKNENRGLQWPRGFVMNSPFKTGDFNTNK